MVPPVLFYPDQYYNWNLLMVTSQTLSNLITSSGKTLCISRRLQGTAIHFCLKRSRCGVVDKLLAL